MPVTILKRLLPWLYHGLHTCRRCLPNSLFQWLYSSGSRKQMILEFQLHYVPLILVTYSFSLTIQLVNVFFIVYIVCKVNVYAKFCQLKALETIVNRLFVTVLNFCDTGYSSGYVKVTIKETFCDNAYFQVYNMRLEQHQTSTVLCMRV